MLQIASKLALVWLVSRNPKGNGQPLIEIELGKKKNLNICFITAVKSLKGGLSYAVLFFALLAWRTTGSALVPYGTPAYRHECVPTSLHTLLPPKEVGTGCGLGSDDPVWTHPAGRMKTEDSQVGGLSIVRPWARSGIIPHCRAVTKATQKLHHLLKLIWQKGSNLPTSDPHLFCTALASRTIYV